MSAPAELLGDAEQAAEQALAESLSAKSPTPLPPAGFIWLRDAVHFVVRSHEKQGSNLGPAMEIAWTADWIQRAAQKRLVEMRGRRAGSSVFEEIEASYWKGHGIDTGDLKDLYGSTGKTSCSWDIVDYFLYEDVCVNEDELKGHPNWSHR